MFSQRCFLSHQLKQGTEPSATVLDVESYLAIFFKQDKFLSLMAQQRHSGRKEQAELKKGNMASVLRSGGSKPSNML